MLHELVQLRTRQLRRLRVSVGDGGRDGVEAFELERLGGGGLDEMGEGLDELAAQPGLVGHQLAHELDHFD